MAAPAFFIGSRISWLGAGVRLVVGTLSFNRLVLSGEGDSLSNRDFVTRCCERLRCLRWDSLRLAVPLVLRWLYLLLVIP
jgi:hypothetical protein